MPAPFRLYNTLTREVEDFTPAEEGKVKLYFCGMTVYDHCHVGHARAMVTSDMVARYLRHRGWDVDFVRNYTDVDDKIIKRAADNGEEPLKIPELMKKVREAATSLGMDFDMERTILAQMDLPELPYPAAKSASAHRDLPCRWRYFSASDN